MNNYVIKIAGLDCANCARELQELLQKLSNVQSATVDFMGMKVFVTCPAEVLPTVLDTCNHFEEVKVLFFNQKGGSTPQVEHTHHHEHGEACTCGHDHHEHEHHHEHGEACTCGHDHHEHEHHHEHGEACTCGHDHHNEEPAHHERKQTAASSEVVEKFTLVLQGLDCANCARELEEEILKLDGVEECMVNHIMQKAFVQCSLSTLAIVKDVCNHFEDVKVIEQVAPTQSAIAGGKRIKVANLCCANCARELEEELNALDGVQAVVDFMNMQISLKAIDNEAFQKAVYTISHFEEVKIIEGANTAKPKGVWASHLKSIIQIGISVLFFLPALLLEFLGHSMGATVAKYPLYALAYIAVGYPVLWNACKNIAKGRVFDENFLMAIASLGAIALGIATGDGFNEGVAVMLLYQVGELLQGVAVGSSRQSITQLMDLKSETATLIRGQEQVVVDPEELHVGDMILVKVGEKIPVDGVIVKGQTALDMKSLNGESLPKDVKEGDAVLSGAINLSKVVQIKVLKEYKDSAVAKILDLVENSTSTKAKSEKFITKFAKYYTPIVCGIALVVALLVPTIIGLATTFSGTIYADWVKKSLGFLVISCPCAVVISVPLTYFSGIGRCAKFGILVKGSTCLDELALAQIVAFDKTGTLTEGTFAVVSSTSEQALQLATCAEKFSSHPIAIAFQNLATPYTATEAEEVAGRGVKCLIDGKSVLCGNAKLLQENGVTYPECKSVSTVVHVALDGTYVGTIEIDDAIKTDAKTSLAELKKQGATQLVMLTGDNPARAQKVADEIGLDGYQAGLLPDQKLEQAVALKQGGKLLYVGDGINDAPVMTCADCAVSMGKVGSDAAIEASDIVLVSDKLSLLPLGKKIARKTRLIVFENIIGSLLVKLLIMVLNIAIPSFPLILAVVGDVGVMLMAVLNALRAKLVK